METANRLALILNHEICSVITAMRFNSKWSVVPDNYYDEDRNETNKYHEMFRNLRSEIFKFHDWTQVDPVLYLQPFLLLIKAEDVSGPITGAAAVAVQQILRSGLLTTSTVGVERAITLVVEDATLCRFESTSNSSDDVYLFNIVQLLGLAVTCPVGVFLSDQAVCQAFQASFMLGDPLSKDRETGAELIKFYARQVCSQIMQTVLRRVAVQALVTEMQQGGTAPALEPPPTPAELEDAKRCCHGVRAAIEILDFLVQLIRREASEPKNEQKSLLVEETITFALDMVHTGLTTCGELLASYPSLLAKIHVDLCHAMCQAALNFKTVSVISGIGQVMLAMYAFLGSTSFPQLETLLERLMIKLAEGRGDPQIDQQEAALEAILDLLRQPHFVHDAFVNCDCRIERSNLYEDLAALMARTAFPVASGGRPPKPGPIHATSLEALTALLSALAAGIKSTPTPGHIISPTAELSHFVDLWTPLCQGLHPDPERMTEALSEGIVSAAAQATSQSGSPEYRSLRAAAMEKHLKCTVMLAVDHFNKDYKKGFQFLQVVKLLPPLNIDVADASDDDLSISLGRFLRVCPGLAKTTVGDLLGEHGEFYLKVLDAYTATFQFTNIKFDAAMRLYLESFRLPGESQKIDRIINSFGRHFFQQCPDLFKSPDAAYVLAYSVIMLNVDRHNSQVKTKMSLESFRRNLRGVNENTDFPVEFLNEIYESISRTPLRMDEAGSMDVSRQGFISLAQLSSTPRGKTVPTSEAGHDLFDGHMFRLLWGPAVHAMCVLLDSGAGPSSSSLVRSALEGLALAAQVAAAHDIEDVADGIVLALSKIPTSMQFPPNSKPAVVFGRDTRAKDVTKAIATIVNKHGDSLRSAWSNVMELVLKTYRHGLLPDSFTRALDGDGDGKGGLAVRDGEATSLRTRRSAARASVSSSGGFLRSFTTLTQLVIPATEPEYPERQATETDKAAADACESVLEECCFEDIFTDSKFLKQESLQHLVKAIIWASGPIPRPAGTPAQSMEWDVSELCLELLFTVLLRNRDRIHLLWARVYEYFQNIFSHSKEVEIVLVQKAIMAMMRLCQRLLPYKADISEPLMKGIQLVALVDEQVAADLAPTIASEVQALLKGAAPFIHSQQAWISICSLLKIIQFDPASFPVCIDTLSWVVKESLTMLNYSLVLQTVVDALNQATPDGRKGERAGAPLQIPALLNLLRNAQEWLGLWWESVVSSHDPETLERLGMSAFSSDSWYLLLTLLARLSAGAHPEVRGAATTGLHRAVVMAEALHVEPANLLRCLDTLLLPLLRDMTARVGVAAYPQADATVLELVKTITKLLLLFVDVLTPQPGFTGVWVGTMEALVGAVGAGRSEVMAESLPEAVKNLLLVAGSRGLLKPGWKAADDTDMWELTWRAARKVSSNLTPAILGG